MTNVIDFLAAATARSYPIRRLSAPAPGTWGLVYGDGPEPLGRGFVTHARWGIDGTFIVIAVSGRNIPCRIWQFIADAENTDAVSA